MERKLLMFSALLILSFFLILQSKQVFSTPDRLSVELYLNGLKDLPPPMFKGTNDPWRLKVLDKHNPYRECTGTVKNFRIKNGFFNDGDTVFNVVSEDCDQLINQSNIRNTYGGIHCEINLADRNKFRRILKQLRDGDIVKVRGIWVEDWGEHEDPGWRELHPVTELKKLYFGN